MTIESSNASVETERELARCVRVDTVLPHPNADKLELATIGGWQVCVKLGEFRAGDLALYCEIDSLLPVSRPEFAFLKSRKESLKLVGEQVYSRVRTIRLRKELSQGLLVPLPTAMQVNEGDDLTEVLGVLKYESKESMVATYVEPPTRFARFCDWVAGDAVTKLQLPWPAYLSKSKEDRVQNVSGRYRQAVETDEEFEASYKLDGTSLTVWSKPELYDSYGVASRNNELSTVDINWTFGQQLRQWLAGLLMSNRRFYKTGAFVFPKWRTGILAS